MRKHNGMRPQDIAILLKLVAINKPEWHLVDVSHVVKVSISEISESLNRSRLAKLVDFNKKKVNKPNLLEFLEHGLRYVFPQEPGTITRGIPTAHSHPSVRKIFISTTNFVWPDINGNTIGLMIEPFYEKQVLAVKQDDKYYELLALVDILRVGKTREIKYAVDRLKAIMEV